MFSKNTYLEGFCGDTLPLSLLNNERNIIIIFFLIQDIRVPFTPIVILYNIQEIIEVMG